VGWAALTVWQALPTLRAGSYRQFSSYDRLPNNQVPLIQPGNKDFSNFLAVCGHPNQPTHTYADSTAACDPGLQGLLIASDDEGPGYVSRIELAVGSQDAMYLSHPDTFADERIRIYVDDLTQPAYDGSLADWQLHGDPPFVEPLTHWGSGEIASYLPISYRSKVRILLDDLRTNSMYYYQVDVVKSSAPTSAFAPQALAQKHPDAVLARLHEAARSSAGRSVWVDAQQTLAPGKTLVLLDRRQQGSLQLLELTFDGADAAALDRTQLTLTWDNQAQPAVALPLCALFGCRQALATFDTLPMSVQLGAQGVTFTLALPMPFASRARVALTSAADTNLQAHARILGIDALPQGNWGYFHASWNETHAPIPEDARYIVAELRGRGKYVGTLLLLKGQSDPETAYPWPLNFLEGDEIVTLDAKIENHGTGTDDYLNAGWYSLDGPFSSPFAAVITMQIDGPTQSGAVTGARWHLLSDAIPFEQSLQFQLEYGANRPQTATDYASVAFYYLR